MINKTSSIEFKKYGSTYEEHISVKDNNLICRKLNTSGRIISHMYCFSCPVYIELTEGIASILIGNSLEPNKLETFAIHHYLKIDANKYFNIIPLSQEIESYLITPANYNLRTEFLNPPYVYKPIVSKLQIEEILGYYYVIKSPNYRFKGEAHKHYELTYVDHGSLDTTVEGTTYTLNSYDLMLYGPNQFHTQQITKNKSCSYLTVIFNMDIIDDDAILNRVFHCDNELHNIFNKFVKASSNSLPYSKTLMLCYLQEIIILLTQYDSLGETKHISTGPMQHFQDGLLQEILDYMNSMITEPLTIEEICHKFSISRSSLQTLFRNNLEISPKTIWFK
ncbi:MAG: AraC family ligand binding domain-containing protein [Thomasclavelia spiroformis]